jgi:hypothetical protein
MKRLWLVLPLVLAQAMGPLEKNQDDVGEGMAAYEAGDYERALSAFERAQKEHGSDPRVHYNRGLALHRLGRTDDAKAALTRAKELDRSGEYAARIHYNLGTIAAVNGQKEEAVREFRQALKKDPFDSLSRHNLEVLLRDLPPKNQQGPDGGADGGNDGGKPDAGPDGGPRDGGSDAGTTDGGRDGGDGDAGVQPDGGSDGGLQDGGQPRDGGPGDGGQGDGGQGDGGQRDGGKNDSQQGQDGGSDGGQGDAGQNESPQGGTDGGSDGGQPQSADAGLSPAELGSPDGGMSAQEAEKLLEPLKRNEKNLQLWRFRQKTQKNDANGKDW